MFEGFVLDDRIVLYRILNYRSPCPARVTGRIDETSSGVILRIVMRPTFPWIVAATWMHAILMVGAIALLRQIPAAGPAALLVLFWLLLLVLVEGLCVLSTAFFWFEVKGNLIELMNVCRREVSEK